MKVFVLPGLDGTGGLLDDFRLQLSKYYPTQILEYPKDLISYSEIQKWLVHNIPMENEFCVVAESFSGPVAIEFAASSPIGLKGTVFIATFAHAPRRTPKIVKSLFRFVPMHNLILSKLSMPFLMGQWSNPIFSRKFHKVLKSVPAPTILGRISQVLNVNCSGLVPNISTPYLYIKASMDILIPMRSSENFANVKTIEGPHFLLQANPEETAREVVSFIKSIPNTP